MEISDPVSSILAQKSFSEVWQVSGEATVLDAIKLMADKNVGSVLVMDGEKLQGILSERDYTRKVFLQGRASKNTCVRDIMTSPVQCIAPGTKVAACFQLMTDKHVRHLPVLDDGKVVGIVSIGDLVKHTMDAQEAIIDHLKNYIVGAYPA